MSDKIKVRVRQRVVELGYDMTLRLEALIAEGWTVVAMTPIAWDGGQRLHRLLVVLEANGAAETEAVPP